MTKDQLKKIRIKINSLRSRSNNIRSRELSALAIKLGRYLSNRGKEPTYVSNSLPDRYPLSIPNHPGAMQRYTAEGILDILEEDLSLLENELDS